MTKDFNCSHHGPDSRVLSGAHWRSATVLTPMAAIAAVVVLAVAAAGCGSSNDPRPPSAATDGTQGPGLAYTQCMRGRGVHNFPDPGVSGNFDISVNVGDNPAFTAATHACRALQPGQTQAPTVSATKLATEVRWARCMRSHGLPGFPDPNGSGQIDSAKFDPQSPTFQRASVACQSLQPSGAVSVAPGAP